MHTEYEHFHTHEHTHGHSHAHDIPHCHDHSHNHDHNNDHAEAPDASPKDIALLKYMLEHNRQHARELAEAGGRLAGEGLANAAELINDAAHYFDRANEKLEKAVGLIGGGV